MPEETKHGLMVKYQFEIDDETWREWKNTVPRSKSLEKRIIELIEADTENRVQPPEQDDIAKSDSSEDTADPVVERDQTDIGAKEDVYDDLGGRVEPEEEARAAEDVLRNLDSLSGSGSKKEARVNAVLTFYEYLRDHRGERVSRGDLEDLAENTGLDVGYTSFTSLWNNWVKANKPQGRDFNTLAQLPGVEMDGDDYVYTGEGE
jgi:hypothetical protein